jgi:hypothetical protein
MMMKLSLLQKSWTETREASEEVTLASVFRNIAIKGLIVAPIF